MTNQEMEDLRSQGYIIIPPPQLQPNNDILISILNIFLYQSVICGSDLNGRIVSQSCDVWKFIKELEDMTRITYNFYTSLYKNKSIPFRLMQDNDNNNTHYRYNNKDLWFQYPTYVVSLGNANNSGTTGLNEMSNKTVYNIQTLSNTWYQGYGSKSGYQPIFYFREKVM